MDVIIENADGKRTGTTGWVNRDVGDIVTATCRDANGNTEEVTGIIVAIV